jgi:hypothetical protein
MQERFVEGEDRRQSFLLHQSLDEVSWRNIANALIEKFWDALRGSGRITA